MRLDNISYLILISSISIILAACSSTADLAQDSSAEVEVSEVEIEAVDAAGSSEAAVSSDYTYPIVDTNQGTCYDTSELIDRPAEGDAFYGQDAHIQRLLPDWETSAVYLGVAEKAPSPMIVVTGVSEPSRGQTTLLMIVDTVARQLSLLHCFSSISNHF